MSALYDGLLGYLFEAVDIGHALNCSVEKAREIQQEYAAFRKSCEVDVNVLTVDFQNRTWRRGYRP